MAALFAVTTPLGVGVGIGIRTTYNENSATALGVQGTFESVHILLLVPCPVLRRCQPTLQSCHPADGDILKRDCTRQGPVASQSCCLWRTACTGLSVTCVHVFIFHHVQVAAGILIYMGLVDLLAMDVFSAHMRSQRTRFQAGCMVALVLGAAAMVRP